MKTFPLLAILPMISLIQPAGAEASMTVLEKRCSEQELQIRQLEEENGRLRSLLETASKTKTPQQAPLKESRTEQPAAPAAKPIYYTVVQGDTISRIARKNKTTSQELAKLNNLEDVGMIRLGQKLRLPAAPVASTKPAAIPARIASTPDTRGGTHMVKDGETFFGIARKYGLSVETLAEANPSVNPRSIRVGQNLKLVPREEAKPVAKAESSSTQEPSISSLSEPSTKPVTNKPLIRSVRVDEEIDFGNFAEAHGMEPAKLNALNGLHLESNTVLAKGSELYVSAQP